MDLHVYTDDVDTVVAEDLPDAFKVYKEYCGFEPEDDVKEMWYQVPEDQEIRIYLGDDCVVNADKFMENSEAKTAAQWAADQGRGWLCSTEC